MDLSKRLSDGADVTVMVPAPGGEGTLSSLLTTALVEGTHPHRREGLLKIDRIEDVLPADGVIVRSEGNLHERRALLAQGPGWIMRISTNVDHAVVDFAAETTATADRLAEQLRPYAPVASSEADHVSIGFWRFQGLTGQPRRTVTDIEAPSWEEIAGNYPAATAEAFGDLVQRGPGERSRLLLLHGPPGTGKTTAIRSLAREWRGECAASVVVDPERLFGDSDYLHQLLTSPGRLAAGEGDPLMALLVIEDADELISRQARDRTGQALSRLLNVTDGLLGQAHPTLVCITTNEPMAELHPAVRRPGRCLANIEFPPLSRSEAVAWLGDDADVPASGASLAELLVLREELHGPVTGSVIATPVAVGYL